MRTLKISLFLLSALLLFSSCNNDMREGNVDGEMTIHGLSDDHWTYFSFETGSTVGSSEFCNETQDAEWASRTDWDFAICGEYIKTNGGDSGCGYAGVQRNRTDIFETLETAPEDGYLVDEYSIVK